MGFLRFCVEMLGEKWCVLSRKSRVFTPYISICASFIVVSQGFFYCILPLYVSDTVTVMYGEKSGELGLFVIFPPFPSTVVWVARLNAPHKAPLPIVKYIVLVVLVLLALYESEDDACLARSSLCFGFRTMLEGEYSSVWNRDEPLGCQCLCGSCCLV